MLRYRPIRRALTAFVAVLSLLSQLALANYLCPPLGNPAAMSAAMAAREPCEGMEQAQLGPCHPHFVDMTHSFEMGQVATPSMPAVVHVLIVPLVLEAQTAAALPVRATPEIRPPPDPVFLATLRLRV
jgi:hypothetical protein